MGAIQIKGSMVSIKEGEELFMPSSGSVLDDVDPFHGRRWHHQSNTKQPNPLIEFIKEDPKCMIDENFLKTRYKNFDPENKTCSCDEEYNYCPCDECVIDRRFFNCAEDCKVGKYCMKKPKCNTK